MEYESYLLTRVQASKRYGLPQRSFDDLYRADPTFPVVRIGKRVMIHRELADKYFTEKLLAETEQRMENRPVGSPGGGRRRSLDKPSPVLYHGGRGKSR